MIYWIVAIVASVLLVYLWRIVIKGAWQWFWRDPKLILILALLLGAMEVKL